MKKLTITAHLEAPVMMMEGYINFDSLLASAVARRDDLPPAQTPEEVVPIEIPVKRHESGEFHLCSVSLFDRKQVDKKYIYKRFPIKEAQIFAPEDQRKIDRGRGDQKDYKIPNQIIWPKNGEIRFQVVGDPGGIRELLTMTTHLGKKRSAGLGSVSEWGIEEGFDGPTIIDDDNKPLRHLPTGLDQVNNQSNVELSRYTYPYWLATDRELVYVPEV